MNTPQTRRSAGLLAEYLGENELAIELNLHVRTLQRWRRSHIGPPFVRSGKRFEYSIESARAWLAAGGTAAKPRGKSR